ncbi:MAG: ATP-binding protein [candidate division Zixibacteria bacterium]|nr:ATP-binding protein [candidate division Zixibacteria bacterium]
MIREIVIVSGKGGTGKTSLAASFAVLAGNAVIADCDVDAADLHLVLAPRLLERHEFMSGNEAVIRPADCTACGLCRELCRYGAVVEDQGKFAIDPVSCEGCGVCVRFCPAKAIDFPERSCGEWMISETRCGTLFHARLKAAAENSGKLVTTVRRAARRRAEETSAPLLLVDGPPGIGCSVIASLTGATLAAVVTEPTVSGEHDLKRVLALARHFKVPAAVCVNKWDINTSVTERIERAAVAADASLAGRVRYDKGVTTAQLRGMAVVETEAVSTEDIRQVWRRLAGLISA